MQKILAPAIPYLSLTVAITSVFLTKKISNLSPSQNQYTNYHPNSGNLYLSTERTFTMLKISKNNQIIKMQNLGAMFQVTKFS